jgi:hypothetical protein
MVATRVIRLRATGTVLRIPKVPALHWQLAGSPTLFRVIAAPASADTDSEFAAALGGAVLQGQSAHVELPGRLNTTQQTRVSIQSLSI